MWKLCGFLLIANNVFGMDNNKLHFKKAYDALKLSEQTKLSQALQDLVAGDIPGFTLDSENLVRFKVNQGLVTVTANGIAYNMGLAAFVGYHKETVSEKKKAKKFKYDDLQNILFDNEVFSEKDIKGMQGDNRIYFKTSVN